MRREKMKKSAGRPALFLSAAIFYYFKTVIVPKSWVGQAAHKVFFLEKKANDRAISLSATTFKPRQRHKWQMNATRVIMIIYRMSSYKFPSHKTKCYLIRKAKEGTDELWLSNFKGTERTMILNRIRIYPCRNL